MIVISSSINLLGPDLDSETKKRVLNIFLCQKERRQRLIVLYEWNIIFSEFLLFSFYSSCWMQDTKSGQNVGALKGMF